MQYVNRRQHFLMLDQNRKIRRVLGGIYNPRSIADRAQSIDKLAIGFNVGAVVDLVRRSASKECGDPSKATRCISILADLIMNVQLTHGGMFGNPSPKITIEKLATATTKLIINKSASPNMG